MRKPGEDNAWRPQTDVLLAFLGCPATKEMSPWRGSSRLSLLLENDPSRTGDHRDGGRRVQAFKNSCANPRLKNGAKNPPRHMLPRHLIARILRILMPTQLPLKSLLSRESRVS